MTNAHSNFEKAFCENHRYNISGIDVDTLRTDLSSIAIIGNSITDLAMIKKVKARMGQDAKEDFETAVKASMADYAASSGVKISDDAVTAYLAGETATKFAANPLSEILVQKYIAQTRDEQLETYNDMRRCNYIDDNGYPVAMTNPKNTTQTGSNRWPLRLPYGASDILSNPNVKEAFGEGNASGQYIFTENVWWAGGNR